MTESDQQQPVSRYKAMLHDAGSGHLADAPYRNGLAAYSHRLLDAWHAAALAKEPLFADGAAGYLRLYETLQQRGRIVTTTWRTPQPLATVDNGDELLCTVKEAGVMLSLRVEVEQDVRAADELLLHVADASGVWLLLVPLDAPGLTYAGTDDADEHEVVIELQAITLPAHRVIARDGQAQRLLASPWRLPADALWLNRQYEWAARLMGLLVRITDRLPPPGLSLEQQGELAELLQLLMQWEALLAVVADRTVGELASVQAVECLREAEVPLLAARLASQAVIDQALLLLARYAMHAKPPSTAVAASDRAHKDAQTVADLLGSRAGHLERLREQQAWLSEAARADELLQRYPRAHLRQWYARLAQQADE